jgi:hypothetical protein
MYWIVVKRGEHQRYDLLHKAFGQTTPVVWDRRVRERRRTSAVIPFTVERRQIERRGAVPASWVALGFVVVQRQW